MDTVVGFFYILLILRLLPEEFLHHLMFHSFIHSFISSVNIDRTHLVNNHGSRLEEEIDEEINRHSTGTIESWTGC